jgi:hypothetical protein
MAGETRLSINNLRSTMQIIKQTTATFNTNFFTLILLSLWLFTFRTLIENGTRNLTRDAPLDSFFSRLDLADRNYRRLHPLRPIFDRDDPFTGKDNADSSSLFTLASNGSSVILQNIEFDDGVKLPEIIHSGIEFDAEKNALGFEDDDEQRRR